MPFVGRESEIARVEAALNGGRNVIVLGKYGIGRTALMREVARRNAKWRFVVTDYGEAGSSMTASILSQLSGRSRHALHESASARQLARSVAAYVPQKRVQRVVIVLDNVFKVTRAKLDLLRLLRESKLAFAAIIEHFATDDAVMRMRIALDPAVVVVLNALDADASEHFFAAAAAEFHLPWSESDVALLARTMHGYPLEMVQTVRAARRRLGEVRT